MYLNITLLCHVHLFYILICVCQGVESMVSFGHISILTFFSGNLCLLTVVIKLFWQKYPNRATPVKAGEVPLYSTAKTLNYVNLGINLRAECELLYTSLYTVTLSALHLRSLINKTNLKSTISVKLSWQISEFYYFSKCENNVPVFIVYYHYLLVLWTFAALKRLFKSQYLHGRAMFCKAVSNTS